MGQEKIVMSFSRLLASALLICAAPTHAFSETRELCGSQSFFLMGGVMGAGHEIEMLNPFRATYEDTMVLGGGYQCFIAEPVDDVLVGLELGGVARIGEITTGEAWGGVVVKHTGWVIGDSVRLSPSVTFGGSVVTETMGVEAERAEGDGLPGELLFYLSPELAASFAENPDVEVFWRLQHRSGAWNTFGGGGSANATMIGVRYSF